MGTAARLRTVDWRDSLAALLLALGGALFVIKVVPLIMPHMGRMGEQWLFDGWLVAVPLFYRFILRRSFAIGALRLPGWSWRVAFGGAACLMLCVLAIHHLAGVRPMYSNTIAFASDVFTGCSIVPLSEELLFRGVIQTGLCALAGGSIFGLRTGTMIAAALFGLMHGLNALTSLNMTAVEIGVGLATLFGLISGALYQRTKNLWPSVALHALANAIGF